MDGRDGRSSQGGLTSPRASSAAGGGQNGRGRGGRGRGRGAGVERKSVAKVKDSMNFFKQFESEDVSVPLPAPVTGHQLHERRTSTQSPPHPTKKKQLPSTSKDRGSENQKGTVSDIERGSNRSQRRNTSSRNKEVSGPLEPHQSSLAAKEIARDENTTAKRAPSAASESTAAPQQTRDRAGKSPEEKNVETPSEPWKSELATAKEPKKEIKDINGAKKEHIRKSSERTKIQSDFHSQKVEEGGRRKPSRDVDVEHNKMLRKVEVEREKKEERKKLNEAAKKKEIQMKLERDREKAKIVTAEYTYKSTKEDELSFEVGEEIVLKSQNNDGWGVGVIAGKTGLFPLSYVGIHMKKTIPHYEGSFLSLAEALDSAPVSKNLDERCKTAPPLLLVCDNYGDWVECFNLDSKFADHLPRLKV